MTSKMERRFLSLFKKIGTAVQAGRGAVELGRAVQRDRAVMMLADLQEALETLQREANEEESSE